MADTVTPNFGYTKPEVGSSQDTWGGKLNANWEAVDGDIFAQTPLDGSRPIVGNFVPGTDELRNLGDTDFQWNELHVKRIVLGGIYITHDGSNITFHRTVGGALLATLDSNGKLSGIDVEATG